MHNQTQFRATVGTAWVAFLLALVPGSSSAQDVGYPPARSPFRDLEYKQELTLFGGWFLAGKDPAGVAPRSGPTFGVRYEANVGGPVSLFGRLSTVLSERRVVDPREPEATRELGVQSWPLYMADFGVALNLTGQKSYRRLVPVLNLGFGFASDFNRSVEQDPFEFGTTFALTYGAGLRVVPGGRFQWRFSLDNYLYKLDYPASYYVLPGTGPAVVDADQKQSFWKNNTAFTLGGSMLFFR
jgi:hypothetical protein